MLKQEPVERTVLISGIPHTCKIRRSSRARRLVIRVDMWRGIEVVIPRWASIVAAERFVKEKEAWVANQLDYTAQLRSDVRRHQFITGESITCLGEKLTLSVLRQSQRQRARVIRGKGEIKVLLPSKGSVRPVLIKWYQEQARLYFFTKSQEIARVLGVEVAKVSIGDHRSQWGSAGARGRLSFNWRLLLAPPIIAQYVAAHEVAHLRHHNHSAAFWVTVATLDSDYKLHRAWLKQNGHRLVL